MIIREEYANSSMDGQSDSTKKTNWSLLVIPALCLLLIILITVSLALGRYGIPLNQIAAVFANKLFGTHFSYPSTLDTVLFNIRVPRILCAVLAGLALAASGASYQGLFKNPMVSPDILGAAAGSGFGAAIAILLSFGSARIQLFAFLFGLLAVCISYAISKTISGNSEMILVLVLTGMVVESLFSALTSIIKYVADPDSKLPEITFWLMGSLSRILGIGDVLKLVIPVIIGSVPLLLLRWRLNVLSFGDEEAQALGVNTKRTRLIIILSATLLTASAISTCGLVGWVGLVVPHISRMIIGPDYRKLMPVSMLVGAIFLLVTDDIARTAFSIEIPLGILTSLLGAPFFIALLFKGKKGWL